MTISYFFFILIWNVFDFVIKNVIFKHQKNERISIHFQTVMPIMAYLNHEFGHDNKVFGTDRNFWIEQIF